MQDEFFSVNYRTAINVIPLPSSFVLPHDDAFEAEIPEAFQMASDISLQDLMNNRLLRGQTELAPEIIEILKLQSRKIDRLMGYVLSMQDSESSRFHSQTLGAGKLTYLHPATATKPVPNQGQYVQVKIFLPEESAAIYCYGQICGQQNAEQGSLVELNYCKIREQDRELLVRASLHIQSKQLKQRALARQR